MTKKKKKELKSNSSSRKKFNDSVVLFFWFHDNKTTIFLSLFFCWKRHKVENFKPPTFLIMSWNLLRMIWKIICTIVLTFVFWNHVPTMLMILLRNFTLRRSEISEFWKHNRSHYNFITENNPSWLMTSVQNDVNTTENLFLS